MKRKFYIAFFVIAAIENLFAQQIKFLRKQEFLINVNYEIMDDGAAYVYDRDIKDYIRTDFYFHKGNVYTIDDYVESYGVDMLCIDNKYLCNSTNYKIQNNDYFPMNSIYSNIDRKTCPRWIPIWYFDALKEKNRKLIADNEPKRAKWDADATPDVWYNEIPEVASLVITNTGMAFYTPLNQQIICLFESLKKKSEDSYEVVAYPDVEDTDSDISWKKNKENFPHLSNGKPIKLRFVIKNKTMQLYNSETNKLCMELIQMDADWVKLYESFIKTNVVPNGLNLPKEYLDWDSNFKSQDNITASGNKNNQQIKTNVSLNKQMLVTENLKLRSGEATTTSVLTVMSAGTKVKILELGKAETIDGINSNWVKVEIISGKDTDGKILKSGMTGWCYGGYLQ